MHKINLVVFWDWNGTIVDDAFVFVDILNVFLKKENLPLMTLNKYRDSFCFPVDAFYKKINLYKSPSQFKKLNVEFVALYKKKMFKPRLKKNIIEVFKLFEQNNIKQYILSAQNKKNLTVLVDYYGVKKYFSDIIGVENDFALGKKEQAFKLNQRVGGNKKNLFVIGDTALDYSVSCSLGARCVLVDWGHYNRRRLLQLSSVVCSSLGELKSCVLV